MGPSWKMAGKAGPPICLLVPCTEERAQPPDWGRGWGACLSGLSELLLNAQEVKLVVLGAELGRRLKKREREGDRESSLSRKQLKFGNSQCAVPVP